MTRSGTKTNRRPWRDAIEGITVAIVMAVFLKYFIVEAYRIPSGSMQPTLMGSPETGVFDRILVDKLAYHFRDPKRWEIVVFKHPLNRGLAMIKRIVGMPGESLRIRHGDLWTRSNPDEPWGVLRRPESVQRGMWRRIETADRWTQGQDGAAWSVEGNDVSAPGPGAIGFPGPDLSIKNEYVDGYPTRIARRVHRRTQAAGRHDVGDLRLSGEIAPQASCRAVELVLSEGRRRYHFRLPGPAAEPDQAPSIVVEGEESSDAHADPWRLEAGRRTSFAVQNLDDELRLELDGEVLLRLEVPTATLQRSRVDLSLEGGGGDFHDLRLARDIYYLGPEEHNIRQSIFDIGPDEYVMLGDNTLDSADTRAWRELVVEVPDGKGGKIQLRGNSRPNQGTGSSFPNDTNPWISDGNFFFCDEWGEVSVLDRSEIRWYESDQPGPKVPRELVTGRALAVFWPLSWKWRVARLKWIR